MGTPGIRRHFSTPPSKSHFGESQNRLMTESVLFLVVDSLVSSFSAGILDDHQIIVYIVGDRLKSFILAPASTISGIG